MGGIVIAQFSLGGGFVVVEEVAQKQECQDVVAEVVGVHGGAQVIGDVLEGFAQFVVLVGHRSLLISHF